MSSSLLLQQCHACLVRLTWIVFVKGTPLKLVDKFTYLGSSVESTEKDIETRLTKAWTAINRLSIIWKSDLTDEMKRSFSQAAVVSILLYGCTTWTLTKRLEKKLDGNYTRMLRAILNKSWQQHPTRHQLYGHLPPIIYHNKPQTGAVLRPRGNDMTNTICYNKPQTRNDANAQKRWFWDFKDFEKIVVEVCVWVFRISTRRDELRS